MKKLALKLADLRVDTFATAGPPAGRGTVAGHYGTTHTQQGQTCDATCGGTCDYGDYGTCAYSCAPTCWGSCGPETCDFSCPVENTCYMGAC
ncbi:MAG TPA: hypothetical protein VFR37_19430 [Longimicrobium sp.]|nr:hypothetical protein [Longimicrobium sp.]